MVIDPCVAGVSDSVVELLRGKGDPVRVMVRSDYGLDVPRE